MDPRAAPSRRWFRHAERASQPHPGADDPGDAPNPACGGSVTHTRGERDRNAQADYQDIPHRDPPRQVELPRRVAQELDPARALVPFSQPAIVTIPLGFAVLIVVSLLTARRGANPVPAAAGA